MRLLLKLPLRKIVPYLTAVFLFLFSFSLLLYKVDVEWLFPWDEAWYATIARNVLYSRSPLELNYNGKTYWDHPPLGFWLIAGSFWLMGESEFSARFPLASSGALAVLIIFVTGYRFKNYRVGLAAALILFSSRWFLFRARTANLDILLLFTQLTLFYLTATVSSKRGLQLTWFWFGITLLSKTLISLTLFPLVVLATIRVYRQQKLPLLLLTTLPLLTLLPLLPWYGLNYLKYGMVFLQKNIRLGTRSENGYLINIENIQKVLLYLHSAVHRWYSPFILSTFASFFWLKDRAVRWLLLYLLLTAFPYFTSPETEIWHLIPIMAPMALIISVVLNNFLTKIFSVLPVYFFPRVTPSVMMISAILIIFGVSWKSYLKEFYSQQREMWPLEELARAARDYDAYVVLKSFADFGPSFAYYSNRLVYDSSKLDLNLCHDRPFLLVAPTSYLIDGTGYELIKQIKQVDGYVLSLVE